MLSADRKEQQSQNQEEFHLLGTCWSSSSLNLQQTLEFPKALLSVLSL